VLLTPDVKLLVAGTPPDYVLKGDEAKYRRSFIYILKRSTPPNET